MNIHLGNLSYAGGSTYLYLQYTAYANILSAYVTNPWMVWSLGVPLGSAVPSSGTSYAANGADSWLVNMWAEISPNSEWEDLSLSLSVPGGTYLWLDGLNIATESVGIPIPSAMWLLGSGLIGLVGFRRKFKKA